MGSDKSFSPSHDFRNYSANSLQELVSFDDDLMNLEDSNLFNLLSTNSNFPFGFPSTRELNRSGFGPDCIQPSLSQLQPPIDMEFEDFFSNHGRFNILPTLPEEPQNESTELMTGKNMIGNVGQQSMAQSSSSTSVMNAHPSMNAILSNEDLAVVSEVNCLTSQYSSSSFNDTTVSTPGIPTDDSPMIESSSLHMDYQVIASLGKKTSHNNSGNNSNNRETALNVNYAASTSSATASYPSSHQVVSSNSNPDMYSMSVMSASAESMKQQQLQQQQQYHQQQGHQLSATSSGFFSPTSPLMHTKMTHSQGIRMASTNGASSSQGHLFTHPVNVARKRVPFERSSSLPVYQEKQQQQQQTNQSLDSYASSSSSNLNKTGHQGSSNLIAQLLQGNNNSQNQNNAIISQASSPYQTHHHNPLQVSYSASVQGNQSNRTTGYGSPSSFNSFVPPSPPFLDSGINTRSPSSTLSSPSLSLDSPTSPAIHHHKLSGVSSAASSLQQPQQSQQQHHHSTRNRPHSVRFAVDDSQAVYSSSGNSVKKEAPVRKISSPARICSSHPAAQQINIFKEPQSPILSPSSSFSSPHQRLSPKSSSLGLKKGILSNLSPSSSHHHSNHASPTHPVQSDVHHHHDKTQYKEHRRVCHINAEQKRRCNIKNGFDTLRQILPSVSQNTNTKISKAAMLAKAAEHIRHLKHDLHTKMEECEHYKGEIDTFNQAIR